MSRSGKLLAMQIHKMPDANSGIVILRPYERRERILFYQLRHTVTSTTVPTETQSERFDYWCWRLTDHGVLLFHLLQEADEHGLRIRPPIVPKAVFIKVRLQVADAYE